MSILILSALMLGIGANSAVFSVVNSVLLHPLSVEDPDRLVFIRAKSVDSSVAAPQGISYPEYLDFKAQSRSFQDIAAYEHFVFNFTGDGPPEQLEGLKATASIFDTFGVHPAIGRAFVASDELPGAPGVAVISYPLWQRRFGGDRSILGKTIILHSQPYSIVGVFPPRDFPYIQDVWVDIGPSLDESLMKRETRFFYLIGRLSHVNVAQAQKEMDIIAARLAIQYPASNKNIGIAVINAADQITSTVRKPIQLIVIAASLILLLTCANVLTVFLAGAIEREKELSIRLALGATRSVIWRQLVLQALMFSLVGAALGLVMTKLSLIYITNAFPRAAFHLKETTVTHSVIWFTIGLAVASTLFSTTLPGLYIGRINVNRTLKGDDGWIRISRSRTLGQGALIVFEVALAAGLTLVSGLLIKSFYEVEKVDMGFDPHHIVTFLIWPDAKYRDASAKIAFYQTALENLRAIPGVQSVSGGYGLPAMTGANDINLQVGADSPFAADRPFVDANSVMPGFFSTMKIGLLQGREFNATDRSNTRPVAIVDEVLAKQMWPTQSALGKRIRVADILDSAAPWREVVGVVRQIKYLGPESEVGRWQVYDPVYQHPPRFLCFAISTKQSLTALRPAAEKAIHALAPDLPLDYFRLLDQFVDEKEATRKLSLLLLTCFAAIGISLAIVGVFGVVSNTVIRRRREIAVRMALGANVKNAIFLTTRLGLLATLAGISLGAIMVACLNRLLSAFLFGVTPLDPQIYLLSAIAIALVTLLAALLPTARLLRLSPQRILRE